MVVVKTSSCFSAQWFLRISSVSTEQQQIYATNYSKVLGLRRNLKHLIIWKRWRFLPTFLMQKFYQCTAAGNLVQEYERKIEQLSKDQKLSKPCSDAVLKLVERGQYICTLDTEEGQEMQHLYREYTMPRNEKGTRFRGWLLKNMRTGPVEHKSLSSWRPIHNWSPSQISVSRQNRFLG